MLKVDMSNEDLAEFVKFGQTGILTADMLCTFGEMVENWEDRVDEIWKQMPSSQTGGTSYTDGYKLTSCGIEAWSEDSRCGYTDRHDATIPLDLFLDQNYVERLSEERLAEEKRQQEQRLRDEANRKKAAEERERKEFARLKSKFESN